MQIDDTSQLKGDTKQAAETINSQMCLTAIRVAPTYDVGVSML